jgi:nucleoside-diphosphate-sugar epimerase
MDLQANVISFLRLLDYVRTQERRPFVVLTGTVTEVGLTDVLPIREDMIDRPITFYDVSKLSAELYLQQYVREGWVEGCTLRLANVYGGIRSGQQRDRGILDRIFAKASAGEAVTVFGDGDNLRDYVYIDDVVSALVAAPAHPRTTSGRTFNIGTGHGRSLKDAFTTVARLADSNARIEHVVPPAGLSPIESRNAIIDSSAFSAATGWKPAFTFDEGLRAAYGETVSRSTRTGAD